MKKNILLFPLFPICLNHCIGNHFPFSDFRHFPPKKILDRSRLVGLPYDLGTANFQPIGPRPTSALPTCPSIPLVLHEQAR